jgi:glycosyltransferase involved in cell wall biosynthesis
MDLLAIQVCQTQYDPPLWNAVSEIGGVSLNVWYLGDGGVDAELHQPVDFATGRQFSFRRRMVAPSKLYDSLARLPRRPTAVIVPGWTSAVTLPILRWANVSGVPLILPSDKTLNEPGYKTPIQQCMAVVHALKNRLYRGFWTTGVLGTQALKYYGVRPDRIATGLYPIDLHWWAEASKSEAEHASAIRSSLCGTRGGVVALAVAKLCKREVPMALLQAIRELRRRNVAVSVAIVGDGAERSHVEQYIQEHGLQSIVHLAGWIPYRQLARWYSAADVFVHVPETEPWGISVSEAMACGLPVIASSTVGSSADLVIHGRTGHLVRPGHVGDIACALERYVGPTVVNPVELSRVVAEFDVRACASRLTRLAAACQSRADAMPVMSFTKQLVQNRYGAWHL